MFSINKSTRYQHQIMQNKNKSTVENKNQEQSLWSTENDKSVSVLKSDILRTA